MASDHENKANLVSQPHDTAQIGTKLAPTADNIFLHQKIMLAIIAILLITNCGTLWVLWRLPRNQDGTKKIGQMSQKHRGQDIKQARKYLELSCKGTDAGQLRSACLAWAHMQWPDFNGQLSSIGQRLNNPKLSAELQRLDAYLYGWGSSWSGENILECFTQHKSGVTAPPPRTALPQLYPDSRAF
jgi:hypothetical protein